MENATQALLIAAGVFVGLMIISLILVGYNEISNYYTAKEQNKKVEQLIEFNKQYDRYDRDDVRGSDLLSLINKILDFNARNDDQEPIEISIRIPNNEQTKMFYYKYDTYRSIKLIQLGFTYTQDNIHTELINTANEIEEDYTQPIATQLAANISTLMGDNTRKTRDDLLTELKIARAVDNNKILKYYQYQQFKRAHYKCEQLEYTVDRKSQKF